MRIRADISFLVVLGCTLGSLLPAQTFTTIHDFTAPSSPGYSNIDGTIPTGSMILTNNTLFGAATLGGNAGFGTVFKVNIDGSGFVTLHNFSAISLQSNNTNSEGALPNGGFALDGTILCGTANLGGPWGQGTVFAINTDGTGFTNLHNFTGGSDGGQPQGGLLLSGNRLYGTTASTVFVMNVDGSSFETLYRFSERTSGTNADGAIPSGVLVLSGRTLYGITHQGGSFGAGTVFAVNTDGTGFTNLHNVFEISGAGTFPHDDAGLILSGDTLYTTSAVGGCCGYGEVFKLNTNGTGFVSLHSFGPILEGGVFTDAGGIVPDGTLLLSGSTLYGTANQGGNGGNGTIFAIDTDGASFVTLHTFTQGSGTVLETRNIDGAGPNGKLSLSNGVLYGAAQYGGTSDSGTLFSIFLPQNPRLPRLSVVRAGDMVTFTWPTNLVGYNLQGSVDFAPFGIWNSITSPPAIINDRYTLSLPITDSRKFFRLAQ